MNLPEPDHEHGYTESQCKEIVEDYNDFCEFMKGKTMVATEEAEPVIYSCDLERYLRSHGDYE